jgi:hypothetical protein
MALNVSELLTANNICFLTTSTYNIITVNHEVGTNYSSIQSLFPSVFGHEFQEVIIMDLAILMLVAAIMLAVTRKLKQPMVIGYIIAGMIIGPIRHLFR